MGFNAITCRGKCSRRPHVWVLFMRASDGSTRRTNITKANPGIRQQELYKIIQSVYGIYPTLSITPHMHPDQRHPDYRNNYTIPSARSSTTSNTTHLKHCCERLYLAIRLSGFGW
jgi:hypothetical protein